jgi:hypothetical protein
MTYCQDNLISIVGFSAKKYYIQLSNSSLFALDHKHQLMLQNPSNSVTKSMILELRIRAIFFKSNCPTKF